MVDKGTWVMIESVVLDAGRRAGGVPEDTALTDLRMRVCGTLNEPAEIGAAASVTTVSGRTETGVLLAENPCYKVDYGAAVPELRIVREQVRLALFGGGV